MTWRRTFLVAGAVTTLGVGALAGAAAGDLTEPPGVCVGSATFGTGAGDGSFTVDSTALSPDDVTTVALEDTVTWTASLVGVVPAQRSISGYVKVDLPAPIPDLTVASWDGPSSLVANEGVEDYSLPAVTPRGVVIDVYGQHAEEGQVFCTGSAKVKVAGSAFSSPATIASLVLMLATAIPLALAGRGHTVLGAFSGLGFGLFLGTTLMFLGVLPLSSPLLTVLPVLGLVGGIVWGKLGLLRHRTPPAPTPEPMTTTV